MAITQHGWRARKEQSEQRCLVRWAPPASRYSRRQQHLQGPGELLQIKSHALGPLVWFLERTVQDSYRSACAPQAWPRRLQRNL